MCVNSMHRAKCQVYLIVLMLKCGDILPEQGETKKISDNSRTGFLLSSREAASVHKPDSKRHFHALVSNEKTKRKTALAIGRVEIHLKFM